VSKDKKKSKDKKAKKQAKVGSFTPSPASGITAPAEATEQPLIFDGAIEMLDALDAGIDRQAKQDAEVARQWLHRKQVDYKLEGPAALITDDEGQILINGEPTGEHISPWFQVDELSGRVVQVRPETEEPGVPVGKPEPTPPTPLEAPADPVLVNGNGQAMIHYLDPATGQEKVKGYTRVTTYIDGLDDKSVLTKWKMRTLLEGGAVEVLQNDGDSPSLQAVTRSVKRTDDALWDISEREKVDQELLGIRRAEVLKEHRTTLERIAEDLMELGGAHEKANKGTDLHRLTELVDNGQPLPDNVTASDRRDVEAYQAKMAELGITTLWTERRVVLDDIQVSGTMDRAYQVKLPGMLRRTRVVGDLKTGSVSYAHGKIATQLLLYARGKGYDWTKPLERADLRLSKVHGLLVHLPQGEGRCDVYVVDLELAARGLDLARQVREWRRDQKRAYDLRNPMSAAVAAPPA
jgi:hypothetical protein